MPLDFSPLQAINPAGAFFHGQEQVREQTRQNMLDQLRAQQMGAAQENLLAQREQRLSIAEERRTREATAAQNRQLLANMSDILEKNGQKLDRPTLSLIAKTGAQTGQDILTQFGLKGLQALDEEDRYNAEAGRLGLQPGGAAPISAPVAPMGAPVAAAAPQQANLLAGTPFDIGGAAAPAAAPAPANALVAPPTIDRQTVQRMLLSPNARIREQGKALEATLPKPTEPKLLTPEEEAQRIRIAQASRPPAQPREPAAPIAVQDPATGQIKYVTREEALGKTPAAAMEGLPPKEIQRREATYPQATSSIKGYETKADAFIKDLTALRNDPGLDLITGPIYGRLGSVSRAGSRAQALYDKITAKGGFQALQDLRDASKTGGALGNVSNQEGKQLTASFAAIDRRQAKADVQAAIDQAIADIEGSKTRMREAYESTYSYKSDRAAPSKTPAAGGIKFLGFE